jgi:hypothetical protein
MKIEDLLNLTTGRVVSNPTITAINSVTVYPSKVDIGDLFISNNQEVLMRLSFQINLLKLQILKLHG